MSAKEYGQYSLVSYVHHLSGERVNVGVVVWHPRFGWRFPVSEDLKRIACIDREADLDRVARDLDAIRQTLTSWTERADSPLTELASMFRNDLVVSEPLNVRVVDIDFTSERLSDALINQPTEKGAIPMKGSVFVVIEPQPGGGFVVSSPELPELLTAGETLYDAVDNLSDALQAVLEFYAREGKPFPTKLRQA